MHTSTVAGGDEFEPDLVRAHFEQYCRDEGVELEHFLRLGQMERPDSSSPRFSMSTFAMRTSSHRNGVSRLHGMVCRSMWAGLWPYLPYQEVPIRSITNGVHLTTWLNRDLARLYDDSLEPDWREHSVEAATWEPINGIPDGELIELRDRARRHLVEFVRARQRSAAQRRLAPAREIRDAGEVLDPKCLTIGYARRFATYKRGLLPFRDQERMRRILTNTEMPVQMVVAGKAHPRDQAGKELIRQIVAISRRLDVQNRIVFLEDYDLEVSQNMVQGIDLWLTLSRRGSDACGTSGIKAGINGALNLGVLDGWFDEGFELSGGWAIGDREPYPEDDDEAHSNSIYTLLETEIVPMFYRDRVEWIRRVRQTLKGVSPRFSIARALREYSSVYERANNSFSELMSDGCRTLRARVQRMMRCAQAWDRVRLLKVATPSDVMVGHSVKLRVTVDLAGLGPDDVRVEALLGRVSLTGELEETTALRLMPVEQADSAYAFETEVAPTQTGRLGYACRMVANIFSDPFEQPSGTPVKWGDAIPQG